MKVDGVDAEAAKSMAYAWQLLMEDEILEEMGELRGRDELSGEEWELLEACLAAAAGGLLASVVISRYGGEGARIT